MQDLIPPLFVRDGHRVHRPPRLSGVVIRRAASGPKGCVIPLGSLAQPLELLGTHRDVSNVNDKTSVVVQDRRAGMTGS